MSYTSVFGGTTIYPSDVSYLAIALGTDRALEWPLESNDPANPAARVIDVTTSGSYSITLPDATQTGAGQTILFNNLPASTNSFTLKDYAGATIATVGIGEQWQVYLAATTTAAGTWRVFRYGASTATVQASALAGYGLTVTANTLSQSMTVTTFNSSPRTVLDTDRSSALVWTGTGTGTLNLLSAVTAGNNFFIAVRNSGGGDLTVDAAGSETIDGDATLALRPGESTNLITDGVTWYTLGLGQDAVFAFDYTSITVTGGTYTLAGSELNRIAYKFVGTLAADQYVVVPSTIQQYWVDNATTGAYDFYLQTGGGAPVSVPQGGRGIYYCNGSNVVDADTASISLPVSATDGGTGQTSYTTGDLLYANTSTTLAKLSDVATGNALISGGVGAAPAWGKIGLTTHVSGTLPVANGGTGTSTAFTAGSVVFAGASGVYSQDNASLFWDDANNRLGIGTTAPAGQVEVYSASGSLIQISGDTSATFRAALYSSNINPPQVTLRKSRGTVASPATVSSGDQIGLLNLQAFGGVSFRNLVQITGIVGTYTSDSDISSALLFSTSVAGAATAAERMRISSAGYVGIGTSTPGYELDVKGAGATTTARVIGGGITTASTPTGTLSVHTLTNGVARTGLDVAFQDSSASRLGGFKFSDTQTPGDWVACQMEMSQSFGAGNEIVSKLQNQDASWGGMIFTAQTNAGAALTTSPTFIWRNFTTEQMRIDGAGSVSIGAGALTTTATDGFLYIPTCPGVPTGVPTAKTGRAPLVIDSANNKLYVYVGGSWVAMN